MSTLFRFEDRYGMCTLANRIHTYLTGKDLTSDGYVVESSLGIPGPLKIGINFRDVIIDNNIDKVVCVFDLDADSKDAMILSVESLKQRISRLDALCERFKIDVPFYYVPTIYAAETIQLFAYMKELKINPEYLVTKQCVVKYQTAILQVLANIRKARKVKLFPLEIPIENIVEVFNYGYISLNSRLMSVLLNPERLDYNASEVVFICDLANYLCKISVEAKYACCVNGITFSNDMSSSDIDNVLLYYFDK